MKKLLSLVFIPLFIIEFIFAVIVIITTSIVCNYNYPYNDFLKIEKTMSLSKNKKNVIYIMVDMTTGFDVTSILQGNSQLESNFTGFTNYENVITTNWGTNAAVPNIFGGYDYNTYYKNHGQMENIIFKQYMKNAMNTLINAFGKSKWDISCISNQYYNYDESKSYWDSNWRTLENDFEQYNVQAINAPDISRLLYYKYPNLYKKLKLPNKNFLYSTNSNYIPITTYLSHTKIENSNSSKFMTIMDESIHSPVVMDKFGNYKTNEYTINNVYNATVGFLKKISNCINYLKINNIYDNTMIIINSDHGNNGTGSLPITNNNYNHSEIDYSAIINLEKKYRGFTRAFPTLLIKPFNKHYAIKYDNNNLYTNADALTFIKEYNKNNVDFNLLDNTKDKRYLKQLSDINTRKNIYMPSYRNDSLWKDDFIHYLTPDSNFGGYSFLVKNSIFDISNYLVSKDRKDYYSADDLNNWLPITL